MKGQPDLKLLATFLAVAEHGSMTRAAEALGYVPSAVSQHVTALERQLGVEVLVRRAGAKVGLTGAGRALVDAAGQLFEATAAYADVVRAIAEYDIAELRIGTYATAMRHLLPVALSQLRQAQPNVRIRLQEMESPEALPKLRTGELDVLLAYRYLPEAPPRASDKMTVRTVGREPMLVVATVATDEPATVYDCGTLDWALGYPHIDDHRLLRRWCAELGLNPRVPYETLEPHASLAMAAAGLAVAFLPATVVRGSATQANPSVRILPLPAHVSIPYREVLAITRPQFHSRFVDELIDLVRDELERQLRFLP
jgi:DNA-binding transcriptional LysR family regulator